MSGIAEIKAHLMEKHSKNVVSMAKRKAVQLVEESGIVFIDEIDKICLPENSNRNGQEASSEGVQRDLLPLLEGTTVATKIGKIDTHKILFICSGAFTSVKPSDLMAEIQGRLPIRVALAQLKEADFVRILSEPEYNILKQQIELMKAENIELSFTDGAIREIARISHELNSTIENIGARRLHTVLEKVMEEISFNCDRQADKVEIGAEDVAKSCAAMLEKVDLRKSLI
eukprot:TRINITY_DN2734_c0_g2_i1.p1 TRINITY_DN2734_c0_g2~~TRINITY_DN2734_c0_g2_i1.p1  ORF type:complete len:237 (+),score=86.35 TRINITY_DN2734_c0_g2_i1:27-713(+)